MKFLTVFTVPVCSAGTLRLVGGDTSSDGQVQVCYNGVWGSIASDGWGTPDAQVVCRQLGFPDIGEITEYRECVAN